MKNKNQEENWEKKLTQFLLSEEILFKNEIGDGWIKISEGKQLTGEYQKIINKVAQFLKSEKEELLKKIKLEYDEPINRDTKWITNKVPADEILELLKSEKEKLLGRIKLEYDKPINRDTKWITNEQSNYWVDGYNKAVEDLEKLKKKLKKKYENRIN